MGGGTARGRQDPKWAPHWQQRAQCGLELTTLQDHDLSQSQTLNWLSHPSAPILKSLGVIIVLWFNFNFFLKFLHLFILETQRETEHKRRRGRESEWDTESKAGSRLWAVSTEPAAGLELTSCEIMTWAQVGCSTNWATQVPRFNF